MQRKRKIGYWIAGILLTPVVVFLLLAVALYIPPVQQWAVQKVTAYASEQTGLDIRLQRIRLKFPLDLDLQEFSATDPDTVLAVKHVVVDLDLSPILKGRLGVDALDITDGVIDTKDLIATVVIRGRLGNFHLKADEISLKQHVATLTSAQLDRCDVDIAMRDTTVIDTTESAPLPWRIDLGDIEAHQTHVVFHTIGDSICVQGGVNELVVKGGDVNLNEGIYRIKHLKLDADSLRYDTTYEPTSEGFDPNHLDFRPIALDMEDFYYKQEKNDLSLNLKRCQMKEKCGLDITALSGHVRLDDTHIQVPDLCMATPHSHAQGKVDMDWSALTPKERGKMEVNLDAAIGKPDLLYFTAPYLTKAETRLIPDKPIQIAVNATGNVDSVYLSQCQVVAPGMLNAKVHGSLTDVLDTEKLGADLHWDAATAQRIRIPGQDFIVPALRLTGETNYHSPRVDVDLMLTQAKGLATLKGNYNLDTEAYNAKANIRNLNLHNFLPKDSIYTLSGKATLNGRGTDLLARSSRVNADVNIDHLRYGQNDINDIRLTAHTHNGEGTVSLYSNNDILRADACATLQLDRKITAADFSLGLSRIDLHALGITEKPLTASMFLQLDGTTNLADRHEVKGSIKAIEIALQDTVFYPLDIDLSLLMSPDTLHAEAEAGDLELEVIAHEGLEQILEKFEQIYAEAQRQIDEHRIDQDTLKHMLPRISAHLKSGNYNPIARSIAALGYKYNRLYFDIDSNPEQGVNGHGYLHSLNTGAVMLDTIQWNIYQDSTNVVNLGARVKNGPKNKQVVFESIVNANLTETGADANIIFFDAKGNRGVDLGAQVAIEDDGYQVHFYPLNPIIAYRHFTLNEDNFIYLHDDNHVEALVDLLADDGTGFKLYSTPNESALQDITLSVHDFNLGELSAVLPYLPKVDGLLAGDFHLVQDEQSMSVSIDASVRDMAYEGAQMGNVGLNAIYLPNNDGTHYVDGIVSQNGREVMLLAGTYNPEGEGTIDAQASLERLPLTLANGFIPDQTAELAGYVTGEMSVTGKVSSPILNGAIATDSMYLNSDMYSLHLRFPNDTIGITGSNLDFNRIEAYSTGKNPVVLDGTVNFRDLDRIRLNLNMQARNFELINAPKNQKAVAYGKVYVNLGAMLTGTLNDMILRGKLDVLGNTDVTYVLTDSPLTVEDELAELVTFVDFADSTEVEVTKTSPQNIDMLMGISIEQAAQVRCLLSLDGTNYVSVEGGGDLTMAYTTQDGIRLNGRYTIVSGLMNYSLMVMSLKNFAIENGSYVEFTGDIMNPRLNISASERVKTTVYENNVPRSVNFDVGLKVTQTLEDMGLEFTLEAPSDMTVSNQLATMNTEERGKVAVTMLATGMYLTESGNGTQGFSATNALNSFLQTQISAISNKALSTIDLNFGIDNTNTASGGTQTDYNFSFAKRFWGNRISLIIGGKVSSGSEAQNTGESIINNVSLEYRLDKSATRYVRIYYDRDTESLLEGDITEMGAGIVLRRKSNRLGELFLFRNRDKENIPREKPEKAP